jgi:hypothetical protein
MYFPTLLPPPTLLLLLLLLLLRPAAPQRPGLRPDSTIEQVHLAFSDDPRAMTVSWSSPAAQATTVTFWPVFHGDQTNKAVANVANVANRTVSATQSHFRQLLNSSHPLAKCPGCVDEWLGVATLDALVPGVRYAYIIETANASSSSFAAEFVAGRERDHFTFAVFGDMGTHVPGGAPSPNLKLLTDDVDSGSIQGVLHVGDFAYDMSDNGGQTAATFFRQIQPVASRIPYMACPGNHEGGTPFAGDFKHYYRRFDMPGKEKSHNSYYSYNVGPAHIVSFSSEAYFWQYWAVAQQFEWLKKDLASVNRSVTPWVITMAHRPMYCSDSDDHDDCTKVNSTMRRGLIAGKNNTRDGLFALEPLFKEHGVDIAFWAHEHTYERLWPTMENKVVNSSVDRRDPYHEAAGVTHIITGAAGGREGHDLFNGSRADWSAVRDTRYGYGRLRLANRTHIHWEEIESTNRSGVDAFWLSKAL